MKKLTNYRKNGYTYKLIQREGLIAIFKGSKTTNGRVIETWEGIEIQSHNGREIAGIHSPPSEYPPSNNQWGNKGWTFGSLESAQAWMKSATEINNMSTSQTPETDEAWDAVSRTPEGTYDSRTSSMDYAIAMSKHGKKLEIERGQLRRKIHAAEDLLLRMIQQSTIVMRDHEDDDAQDDLWDTIDLASRFLQPPSPPVE